MRLFRLATFCAMMCALAGGLQASSYMLDLSLVLPTYTAPATTGPWLSATFTDIGTNDVQLTMKALNLTGNESVARWFFNIDPALRAGTGVNGLAISYLAGVSASSVSHGSADDCCKADADGWYDVEFVFATGNSASGFTNGQTSTYELKGKGTQTIDAADFIDFVSSSSNGAAVSETGAYMTIARINDSVLPQTFVAAVPEPGTWGLFCTGLIPLVSKFARRRRRQHQL